MKSKKTEWEQEQEREDLSYRRFRWSIASAAWTYVVLYAVELYHRYGG